MVVMCFLRIFLIGYILKCEVLKSNKNLLFSFLYLTMTDIEMKISYFTNVTACSIRDLIQDSQPF